MNSTKSILLKTIRLENFGTYKNQEIDFQGGVTIITGPNGSGKSLLLDAIRLAFGLHARSVRMDKIEDYIMGKAKKATIDVVLSNPEVSGGYYLKSNNPEFNQQFLGHQLVEIRRTIVRKGGSFFSIKKESGWIRLDTEKRQALQEVYFQIGLIPTDELNFITGEDYGIIIRENPHKRFEVLTDKLGLNRIQADYEETRERLDQNQSKRTELESNLTISKETLVGLEEKYKQFREMQQNEKTREEYEKELKWVPIQRKRTRIEQMKKGVTSHAAEMSELSVNIKSEKRRLAEQQGELEVAKKDSNKIKIDVDDSKSKTSGNRAVINQKSADIDTIKAKIKHSEETIAKKKLKKATVEKEMTLLQKQPRGVSGETVARRNELEQDEKQCLAEITKLETEVRKEADNILEELVRKEEQILTEINEQLKEKSEFRNQLFQKDKQNRLYDKPVQDFKKAIFSKGLSEKAFGPISAVCNISDGSEAWRRAIETGLGRFLSYFITDDENTYTDLIKIRRSNPSFSNIPLGFVQSGKGLNITIPKNQVIYNSILDVIEAPKEVRAFLSDNAGKTILIHDRDDVDIKALMQVKGRVFLSKSLKQFKTGQITLRSEKASSVKSYRGVPIGTSLDSMINLEEHPRIKSIDKEVSALEQNLKKIKAQKSNYRDQPELKKKFENLRNLQNEELPNIRSQLKQTEESIISEDPSLQLKVQSAKINDVVNFIKNRENQISEWEKEIIENQKIIQDLQKGFDPINKELNMYEKDYNKALQVTRDLERNEARIESNLARLENSLKNQESEYKSLEKRIEEERDELVKEEEEIKKAKIKEPSSIRAEAELKGRIAELAKNINQKRANGISSADEDKFAQHQKFITNLSEQIAKSLSEYKKLLNELTNWRGKWESAFDESIIKVGKIFNDILHAIGASGRIEIANRDNPKSAQAFFWTKFGNEEEREIRQHSSGQKQAALVALIIALQSQSSSPITAIDEFDKGLDSSAKARLVEIIPKLVTTAIDLRETYQAFPIEQQFFVVLPDIDPDVIPNEINFFSIFKADLVSSVQEN